MFFNMVSIPFFKVKVEEGQPLHAPCKITFTVLVWVSYDWNKIFPPSLATAGFTYSSKISTISCDVSSNSTLIYAVTVSDTFALEMVLASAATISFPSAMKFRISSRNSTVISSHSATSYLETET